MLAIYTPTYNRANELIKLYQSLAIQKNKDFFWLVVDDGSNDETEELVKQWINEEIIDIRYLKKINGGKHTAVNIALDIVDGYWNMCVDSDDWLIDENVTNQILEDIYTFSLEKNTVSIIYPREFENVQVKNMNRNPIHLVDCNPINKKDNVLETTLVSRPGAYGKIRFPIFEGENFISEGAIETPKLMKGKQIYINTPIVKGNYLESGLTNNIIAIWLENPKGYYYVRNLQTKYYKKNKMIKKYIPLGQIIAFNLKKNTHLLNGIDDGYRIEAILSIPLGVIYWMKKFKNHR